MKHKKIKDALYALYDGELSGEMCLEVESHMKTCGECRQIYQNWGEISKTFLKVPQVAPTDAFVENVMERIEALDEVPQTDVKYRWPLFRWMAPALGLGFAAFFLTVMPETESTISTDDLLLVNGRNGFVSQWAFAPASPEKEDLLEYVLEEP